MLKIQMLGNPILRQKVQPVVHMDPALHELAEQMIETMLAANGLGLAGPQIGESKAIIVIDTTPDDEEGATPMVLLNPQIMRFGRKKCKYEEGCLSIPGVYAEIERPAIVRVRYQNLEGEWLEDETDDVTARVLQHEIDHLNGVLFIDYLPEDRRAELMQGFNPNAFDTLYDA